MNYGRSGVEQEREALQATASRAGNRIAVIILRIIMFLLIAACLALLCLGIGAYRGVIDDAPQITDANIMPLGYASFVYDQDGNQIQKLNSVEGNRVSVSFKDIPLNMQHAIVAIEDSRFYEHNGVDPHGMIRAILVALQSGFSRSEGAGTVPCSPAGGVASRGRRRSQGGHPRELSEYRQLRLRRLWCADSRTDLFRKRRKGSLSF